MGGPKPSSNAGGYWVDYEEGGILKRDRLVSGLLHINAVHTPQRWKDNRKAIALTFVDSIGSVYSSGSGSPGYYITIWRNATDYSIFWFNPRGNNSPPGLGGADEVIEVDISAYYNQANAADRIATEFQTEFGSSNANSDFRIKLGDCTSGDEKNDHIAFLRYFGTPEVTPDSTDNILGDFSLAQTGGQGTYRHEVGVSKETDFKQALFNNTSDDVVTVETYSRRSPFNSSEAPPWRGELYDDGRFNTGSNDDTHTVNSRHKTNTTSYSSGLASYDSSEGYYNASMGDHCTYLYHMTAGTRIQDNPRLWGTRITNGTTLDLLNDNGHPPVWFGDFDVPADASNWTQVEVNNAIGYIHQAEPDDGNSNPEGTGCLTVTYTGPQIGDNLNDFGSYGVRATSQTVVAGTDYKITWDIDHNTDGAFIAGSGLMGLVITDNATFGLGSTIYIASGSGTGGVGITTQGTKVFTCPPGVTTLYVWLLVNPLSGTVGGIGNMVWVAGQMEINMVSLQLDSVPHYSDILNFNFNCPLSNVWYTSKPDDGLSFFWIRSHLLSVHNNSEQNNDEFLIRSHRVQFNATTDAAEEAGTIDLGYNGSFPGLYYPHGTDVVDNYHYRQWKNFKPGDMIRISGADDSDNNGVFQLRWDWDHNSEYYIGYSAAFPSTGDEFPNMQFQLCPFRIKENGNKDDPHTLIATELLGQLFEEDITISVVGQYATGSRDKHYPLVFTATPAVDMRGYVHMQDQTNPGVASIRITNPGTGFNNTSAASLVIEVDGIDGSTIGIGATGITSGGVGYTQIECVSDHDFEVDQAIELFSMADSSYDGEYTVTSVVDATTFTIDHTYTTPSPNGSGSCRYLGLPSVINAAFTHTAQANINTSPLTTIENLTRRWQDSSNAKLYDYSVPSTPVDDPPPTGIDVHAVPYVGRDGNSGRVSNLNHMYDSYDDDYSGMFTVGRRDEMFSQQHEYEGRMATHHKMETWHNPVSGTPEIYGKRSFGISHIKDIYNEKEPDKNGDLVDNPDYVAMFSNGRFDDPKGSGYDPYRSPYYGKVYNVSQIVFGAAKVVIRVPVKAYRTLVDTSEGTTLENEPLYDTNIDVMWQPFGETGMIKLAKGEQPIADLT